MTLSAVEGLVAGWPAGLALGASVAARRRRESRRRRALNRALHELRRPLQVLSLSSASHARGRAPDALALALSALADLDREINSGGTLRRDRRARRVDCRQQLEAALERWRAAARRRGKRIELRWLAGGAAITGDPARLAQALDNLIANAVEHGGARIRLEAWTARERLTIAVRDSEGLAAPVPTGVPDGRRGHGLGIVTAIAADLRGQLTLRPAADGTTALLRLPLAPSA